MAKKSIAKKPKGVNDQQLLCAMCFIQNGMKSWTQAAKDAGYPHASAHNRGAAISKMPAVKKLIADHMKKAIAAKGLTKEDVLSELSYAVNRDGGDLVDDNGLLLVHNIKRLPKQVRACIEGIEQEEYRDREGEVYKVVTKVKLVSKTAAIKMAMDYFGLNSPQEVHHTLHISWDEGMRRTMPNDKRVGDITVKIGEEVEDDVLTLGSDEYTVNELIEGEEE